MAMTEEQRALGESEIANLQVADERSLELLKEMMDSGDAVPALQAFTAKQFIVLGEGSPGWVMGAAIDPNMITNVGMALMHAFLAGVEWGKAGRDLYRLPVENACDDPTHDHYVGPKEGS
jgi:hypothetical protein